MKRKPTNPAEAIEKSDKKVRKETRIKETSTQDKWNK